MLYLKTLLDSFDPKWWYLATTGVIFLLTWAWRRFLPNVWAFVIGKSSAIAQLPILVMGALISAGPAIGKPLWDVVQQTILGAVLVAFGAQGLHAMLKALPVPYDGAQKKIAAAEAAREPPKA